MAQSTAMKERLLQAVEHGDERETLRLYQRAIKHYSTPGSGSLSDDFEFWREINGVIESAWGPEGLARIKKDAWSAQQTTTQPKVSKRRGSQLPRWASAKQRATRYVVALDDSGQKEVRPSTERRCFFMGGVVLPASELPRLRHTWAAAKHAQIEGEVKARSYVSSPGFEDHPDWAEALLSVEMDHWRALPLWIAFDKGEASSGITLPTRKGGRRIDVSKAITLVACSLAVHLQHVRGRAETVCIDHMSSSTEEAKLQDEWHKSRETMGGKLRRTLPTELSFVDSKAMPEVQVADVLTGLLRAAHEARRPLAPGLSQLLREAEKCQLRGFHPS